MQIGISYLSRTAQPKRVTNPCRRGQITSAENSTAIPRWDSGGSSRQDHARVSALGTSSAPARRRVGCREHSFAEALSIPIRLAAILPLPFAEYHTGALLLLG
jgi:hypothetical protein